MPAPAWRPAPTWQSAPTAPTALQNPTVYSFAGDGAPSGVRPVFPTIVAPNGQVFASVKSIGAADSNGNQAGHVQWADYIPAGVNATYPHGAVIYYPWGESKNHTFIPPSADVPYGAILVFAETADSPTRATEATDFQNTANWHYYDMRTICAADPNAASMLGWGGGRLDDYTAPKWAYGAGNSYPPTAPNLARVDNPVMTQINVTADLGTAAAYRTVDLRSLLGLTLAQYGGQFVGGVAGGRFWYCPTFHKYADGSSAPHGFLLSVDLEPDMTSNYFQNAAHWHAMDTQTLPFGADFAGFQGATTVNNRVYFCQFQDGTWLWELNAAGPSSTGGQVDALGHNDVARLASNYVGIDPTTIHPSANGYINAGVINDPATGLPRYVIFSPFQSSADFAGTGAHSNPILLSYDLTNPAGGTFATLGNWAYIDTTTITTNDVNQTVCKGYQGVYQDAGGYCWLLPSDYNELSVQTPWLCWNPLYAFGAASSWNAYPSYTVFGDKSKTVPLFSCGAAIVKRNTYTSIYPACYQMPAISAVQQAIMPLLNITTPANGPGVPAHP